MTSILFPVQRILVIQLKRIGDFILTVPALVALREAMPKAEIVLLVPSTVTELAQCIAEVDRVISYREGSFNLESWSSALAGEWTACLDFSGTGRSSLLTLLSQATRRIGYAKFAGNGLRKRAYTELCEASVRELHTVDFHHALLAQYTGSSPSEANLPIFKIPLPVKTCALEKFAQAGLQGRFAILHPGTAREEKFWMDERWSAVAECLHQDKKLTVALTGAGDRLEMKHLKNIKKYLSTPVIDLTGQLTLVELAILIRDCELIIGVDSMAMHLASIYKKPQIALFGPTNPFHWRPLHDRAMVLQGETNVLLQHFSPQSPGCEMKLISTDAVISAIRKIHPFP